MQINKSSVKRPVLGHFFAKGNVVILGGGGGGGGGGGACKQLENCQ